MVQWNFGDEAERLGGYISKRVLSVLLIIVVITSTSTTPRLNAKTNNYKYAKTTVNVRKKPNKKSKIVGIEKRQVGFDQNNTYKVIITEPFHSNGAMKFWK